jgi:hypothetical protein
MISTPTRPSAGAAVTAASDHGENDASSSMPVTPVSVSSPDRDGRWLEERTFSMDYDADYHYKDTHVGKHYKNSHANGSTSSLGALKDKIADKMHMPEHAPHLVPTAADHRSRYLPGVLYVPMLIVRWLAHPFRLLLGTAEDSDREQVHTHNTHERGTVVE